MCDIQYIIILHMYETCVYIQHMYTEGMHVLYYMNMFELIYT